MTSSRHERWRHKLTHAQRSRSDRQLVAELPAGTALSIYQELLWDVLMRSRDGEIEYVVVELRPEPEKPVVVYGPVGSRNDALGWASLTAAVFRVEKMQTPSWPWE